MTYIVLGSNPSSSLSSCVSEKKKHLDIRYRLTAYSASRDVISLPNMASALQTLYRSDDYSKMDHLAFLNAILTPEYDAKMEKRLSNRLENANLKD